MAKIVIHRGDSYAEDYALTNDDGSPFILTGGTIWWTLKRSVDDLDAAALLLYTSGTDAELAITDAPNGEAELRIPAADTAVLPTILPLRWEVQVKAADGSIATIDGGTFVALPDVTRATA